MGEVTYHVTQILSGHGCFQQYLYKRHRMPDPRCVLCTSGQPDDAEHTLMRCEFFRAEREQLMTHLKWNLTIEGLVPKMLDGEDEWRSLTRFISAVMSRKETLERKRCASRRTNGTGPVKVTV